VTGADAERAAGRAVSGAGAADPRPRRAAAAFAAIVAASFALRAAWPLADPAAHLSWSNGVYTDPAAITQSARNQVLWGEWIRDESRDLVFYPLLNGMAWAAYRVFGPGRLPLQILSALLGTAAVAACGWAAARGRGPGAGLAAAAATGGCFWLAMFSRVPVAENLVAAMLALAWVAATGRGAGAGLAAGALAGAAAFFGKVHAVAFLPALLVFLGLRARSAAAALPAAAGIALTAAVWAAAILVPFRTEILDQAARSEELYGALPVLRPPAQALDEIVLTLRAGWLFFRMPVLGALGILFAVGTLLDPAVRRRRLEDGTALLALWLLAAWLLLTALPYKAPRYFIPAALPLVAGAACLLHELLRGDDRPRASRATVTVWLLLLGLVAVDVAVHLLAAADDWAYRVRTPGAIAFADRCTAAAELVRSPRVHAAVGLALGGAAAVALRGIRPPPARGLVAAAIAVQGLQIALWAGNRAYALEEAKESLDAIIAPDAVVYGTFAPALVQDSRRIGVPQFGAAAADVLERHGVTHVVFAGEPDAVSFARAAPEVARGLVLVRQWPFRTRNVRLLQLLRLPGAAAGRTDFERAVDLLDAGDPEAALRALGEMRRKSPGGVVPDVPAREARAHYERGDLPRAREKLEEAVALRPTNPEDWFNLGMVRHRLGDPEGARAAWRRALRLDPWDEESAEMLGRPAR
jgi:tetratricopeptide (TPR) repeat protein